MPTNDLEKEIEKVLTSTEEIPFEKIMPVDGSPLSDPIRNKEGEVNTIEEEPNPPISQEGELPEEEEGLIEDDDDAPEQLINEAFEEQPIDEQDEQSSEQYTKMVANTIIGTADNLLEIGGGFFVKITKHKEYFEFHEIIQQIDEQNHKNVKRLRLEKEDKALLRPIIAEILRKQTKQFSPEQQLLGCLISIIVKKAQVVMDIKKENQGLENRLKEIIAKRNAPQPQTEPTTNNMEEVKLTIAPDQVEATA